MNTLHHVTYVVRDLAAGVRQLEQLAGAAAVIHETLPGRGVRSVRARVGGVWLVFVEPVGPGVAGWRSQDLVMSLPGGATVQLCEAGES